MTAFALHRWIGAIAAPVLLLCSWVNQAHADAVQHVAIQGEVVSTRARWGADRRTIYTESTIRTIDGATVRAVQLGGTINGIGMRVSHAPPILRPGQRVLAAGEPLARTDGQMLMLRRASIEPSEISYLSGGSGTFRGSGTGGTATYGLQRTVMSGTPMRWSSGCVTVYMDEIGSMRLDGDEELATVEQAFRTWEEETNSVCTGLNFAIFKLSDVRVGEDAINTVVFRDTSWCRLDENNEPILCYPLNALAVTTTFFVDNPEDPQDGEIFDAEIEVNTNAQAFSTEVELGKHHLLSTVTHEVGHFLGLAHNCYEAGEMPPTDAQGAEVPPCNDLSPSDPRVNATMFPIQNSGEDIMATLEDSDILGACAVGSREQCDWAVRPRNGGCAAGGATNSTGFWLLLVALGLWSGRRRARTTA